MKKIKRITGFGLCILFVIFFTAGCNSKAKEYEKKIVGEWKLQNALVGEGTILTFNEDLTCKEVLLNAQVGNMTTFSGTYEFDKKGILHMTSKKGDKIRLYEISFEDNDTLKIAMFGMEDQEYIRQK